MKSIPVQFGIKSSKKTSARSRLVKECDGLMRQIVFARDGEQCVKCEPGHGPKVLQMAHVRPKGTYPRMRFVSINGLCLCLYHHLFWAHKDPVGFTDWFREKYPEREPMLMLLERYAAKLDLKQIRIELQMELNQ